LLDVLQENYIALNVNYPNIEFLVHVEKQTIIVEIILHILYILFSNFVIEIASIFGPFLNESYIKCLIGHQDQVSNCQLMSKISFTYMSDKYIGKRIPFRATLRGKFWGQRPRLLVWMGLVFGRITGKLYYMYLFEIFLTSLYSRTYNILNLFMLYM